MIETDVFGDASDGRLIAPESKSSQEEAIERADNRASVVFAIGVSVALIIAMVCALVCAGVGALVLHAGVVLSAAVGRVVLLAAAFDPDGPQEPAGWMYWWWPARPKKIWTSLTIARHNVARIQPGITFFGSVKTLKCVAFQS